MLGVCEINKPVFSSDDWGEGTKFQTEAGQSRGLYALSMVTFLNYKENHTQMVSSPVKE